MKMYRELAARWPLLSAPADYDEEAAIYHDVITRSARRPVEQVLELGCGGGNNASHLKARWRLTLTDLSEEMLAVSRALNPECEHIQGDMRTLRLQREFDAVLVHDAVMYMLTEGDLRAAIETAAAHLRPGGAVLFAPDDTLESFRPGETSHGGHDGDDGRALRYLQWELGRTGNVYRTVFVIVMRDGEQVRVELDEHDFGLFSRRVWLDLIEQAGLEARALPYEHSTFDPRAGKEMFLGIKP